MPLIHERDAIPGLVPHFLHQSLTWKSVDLKHVNSRPLAQPCERGPQRCASARSVLQNVRDMNASQLFTAYAVMKSNSHACPLSPWRTSGLTRSARDRAHRTCSHKASWTPCTRKRCLEDILAEAELVREEALLRRATARTMRVKPSRLHRGDIEPYPCSQHHAPGKA